MVQQYNRSALGGSIRDGSGEYLLFTLKEGRGLDILT